MIHVLTFVHDGLERKAYLSIPLSNENTPADLIIAFHGGGGNPISFSNQTKLHESPNLVCYPLGTCDPAKDNYSWNADSIVPHGWAERNHVDDIGFITALIEEIKNRQWVANVFAVGLSKGGMLVYRLLSEGLFTRAAVVATTMTCEHRPLPAPIDFLHVHATGDKNIPIAGKPEMGYQKIWEGIHHVRKESGCPPFPVRTESKKDILYGTYCSSTKDVQIKVMIYNGGDHGWEWTNFTTTDHILEFLKRGR